MFVISENSLDQAKNQLWVEFEQYLTYFDNHEKEFIELAFYQMCDAHDVQRRKSGEFYILHPVMAAITLCKIGLDKDTIAACLLHDVPEDTQVGISDIEKNFGKEVAFLVSGITKLGKVKYQGDQRYAENLRKMFVTMSQDLRVIFIKLADRLHNLQTLEHLPREKQQRIALESLEIYAPIAERLGMGKFRGEIEDLVFPFLYPERYKEFLQKSELKIDIRKGQVDNIIENIKLLLQNNHLSYESIQGRAKRYYSIYKKIVDRQIDLENMKDLVAIRIITKEIGECYEILSMITREFEIIPNSSKDYISHPKPNGYQSLHVSVIDPVSKVAFEIQIRTKLMHEFCEYGVAAHWAYKENRSASNTKQLLEPENLKWITELVELSQAKISDEEYLKKVKIDVFADRIFVLTPKNDVIDLQAGATVLDFAFMIHENIGSKAVMAKVNGNPVKLTQVLQSGDMVEIMTDKKQTPKQDWLNYVTTNQAAKKIRAILRKKEIEK